jgi:hypothetical protein
MFELDTAWSWVVILTPRPFRLRGKVPRFQLDRLGVSLSPSELCVEDKNVLSHWELNPVFHSLTLYYTDWLITSSSSNNYSFMYVLTQQFKVQVIIIIIINLKPEWWGAPLVPGKKHREKLVLRDDNNNNKNKNNNKWLFSMYANKKSRCSTRDSNREYHLY